MWAGWLVLVTASLLLPIYLGASLLAARHCTPQHSIVLPIGRIENIPDIVVKYHNQYWFMWLFVFCLRHALKYWRLQLHRPTWPRRSTWAVPAPNLSWSRGLTSSPSSSASTSLCMIYARYDQELSNGCRGDFFWHGFCQDYLGFLPCIQFLSYNHKTGMYLGGAGQKN